MFRARSLSIFEPMVVNKVCTGMYPPALAPHAAVNFARGHYSIGKEIFDVVLDHTMKLTIALVNKALVSGVCFWGVGSGLGCLLLGSLSVNYGRNRN